MTHSRFETLVAAAGLVIAIATGASAAAPSQADIEICNRKAAEVKLRTAKGAHDTPQASEPHRHDSANAQPADGAATAGMDPIGETDGVYRQAYTSCINQRTQ